MFRVVKTPMFDILTQQGPTRFLGQSLDCSIVIKVPELFFIHHQIRMVNLTRMLNITSNASLDFFFIDRFLKESGVGEMKNLGNEADISISLNFLDFIHNQN